MNKKQIFLWTLYDFANSITIGVWAIYFAQWLVIDKGVSDFWFNTIFGAASVFLIFAGPIFGAIADKRGNQMRYIRIATVAQYLLGFGTVAVILIYPSSSFTPLVAALGFTGILFFYQFSIGFYNALLTDLAPVEKRGFISGIGQAGNWLGQVAGLLATLPFANGALHWFGEPSRVQPLLPSVFLFVACSLPMLIWFKTGAMHTEISASPIQEVRAYWRGLRRLWLLPGVGLFLLAFFFFNDALLTTANNFPIYMQQVFGIPDTTKVFLMLGILTTSALGALGGGWLADRIGMRRLFKIILAVWILFFPILGLTNDFFLFTILVIIMGILYGATWSVTRAVMASLLPRDKQNYGFSYYTLFERFSTFVGPIVWGLITTGFISFGPVRYQLAAISMGLFVVIGFFLARKLPRES